VFVQSSHRLMSCVGGEMRDMMCTLLAWSFRFESGFEIPKFALFARLLLRFFVITEGMNGRR
jgi:hypothetical protein